MLAASVVLAIGVVAWWLWPRRIPRGPVVLISIDTLRADHLPVYGYAKGRTPAIDALARDGIVFERAYAHVPLTLPSHTSILTGLLPFEHGVRDNLGFTLKKPTATMASLLRDVGYRTGGFVSAYVLRPETGIDQGFDAYDARLPAGSEDRAIAQIRRAGVETLAAAERWLSTLLTDQFFLFLHLYEPHRPYAVPAEYRDLDPYDGEIALADAIVARLVNILRSRGWYDQATIILLADHGEGLGDHGEEEHGLFLYDATVHVPLIVKLPSSRDEGRQVSAPVQHIDLLPTVAALAGVPVPKSLRGRNLLPLCEGRGAVAAESIYAESFYPRYHFGWSELQSITEARYRFIDAPHPELYDLAHDGGEARNLAATEAPVRQRMTDALETLVAHRSIGSPDESSAETRRQLASLGYVSLASRPPADQAGHTLADPKDKIGVLVAYRHAMAAIGLGDLQAGARALRGILATEPAMSDVWSQYGSVLLTLGRREEAVTAFEEIARWQPQEPIAYLDAAKVLISLNRLPEARSQASQAIEQMPAAAHEVLARIALADHDRMSAEQEADLAAQADPLLPMPDFVRGRLEYDKAPTVPAPEQAAHYDAALRSFLQAHDHVAGRTIQIADLDFDIADCLARLNRTVEAEGFFKEEIALYPKNIKARAGLAMLYLSARRLTDADEILATMLEAAPSPESYTLATQLYRLSGQPDRAEATEATGRNKFAR